VRAQKQDKKDLLECAKYELDLLREYHLSTFNQEPDLEDFIRDHTLEEVLEDGLTTLKKRAVLSRFAKDQHKLPKVLSQPGLAFYATHGDRRIYSPTADKNIVVVGANDWGFALTYLVGNRILEEKRYLNASLTLYDSRKDVARQMGLTRCPPGKFEEYHLPKNSFVTSDPTSAFRKASEVLLVSSLSKMTEQAEAVLESSQQGLKIVVGTCGFEPETHRLPCQVVYDLLEKTGRSDVEVYSLVGPVRDEDLVKGMESTGVLAGPEPGLTKLADLFDWPPVSVITSHDCLGVQAAAILAGIYAMWGHYLARSDKLKGPSRTGVYMARAAKEAQALAMALGADQETFAASSPAWTANFIATGLGRGYREFVRKVAGAGKKTSPPKAAEKLCQQLGEQGEQPLAYQDLYSAHALAQKHGLDLPILNEAFETLYGK
jgi:glycerol-3-phosphate dehydrogenase